ncbi:chemotaxis protein CheW [Aestuariirhabdus sp. Z084]|uniref:chemotaxis protein CheW n=1 Tax=Aestuariirhabdus haliotis TaxID=2918751 RepID=UPI00201B3EAF|nr:chemotaxis protein CheW [Aestuariirhabdus haliotis]MCL6414136.1 chemotaxis protein CheW [Aestuariirhabdus haliotis]MCL6418068.1 chemotaxis protein CheW [Aestuariirhabdus haliotis]
MANKQDKALTPFELLQDMAARSHRHALGLPSQVELKTYWSGIGFRLGGQRYVAPLGEVAEILTVPGYTQLPGVKSWVKGISNVRGRLLPIMDLGDFLGNPLSARRAQRRVLVVDHEEIFSGLVVDEVMGMQHFVSETFSDQLPDDIASSIKPFVSGVYSREHEWQVFSLFSLAQHPDFMRVAV